MPRPTEFGGARASEKHNTETQIIVVDIESYIRNLDVISEANRVHANHPEEINAKAWQRSQKATFQAPGPNSSRTRNGFAVT
jgi:hypothetical protein